MNLSHTQHVRMPKMLVCSLSPTHRACSRFQYSAAQRLRLMPNTPRLLQATYVSRYLISLEVPPSLLQPPKEGRHHCFPRNTSCSHFSQEVVSCHQLQALKGGTRGTPHLSEPVAQSWGQLQTYIRMKKKGRETCTAYYVVVLHNFHSEVAIYSMLHCTYANNIQSAM